MEATLTTDSSVTSAPSTASSRQLDKKLWTARILGSLVILFLLVDAVAKILQLAPVMEGTAKVGFSTNVVLPLGIVLLISTLLYAFRRTAVLGAILLTGYLGGAVCTHVRLGQPFWMPIVFGVIIWGCLFLRDARIRALLPLVRS